MKGGLSIMRQVASRAMVIRWGCRNGEDNNKIPTREVLSVAGI